MQQIEAPSIQKTSFHCPHCRALAQQFWFQVTAEALQDNGVPHLLTEEDRPHLEKVLADNEEADADAHWEYFNQRISAAPFLHHHQKGHYVYKALENVSVSRCYNCEALAIWIGDKMNWPAAFDGPAPNVDMPPHIRADFEEAGQILLQSPRGAAALLRLAIQKLCIELGEPGKDLNKDIGSLVKKGLDTRIQKAMDVVRVTGNNAVHPGQMDLKDDTDAARALFNIVNLIVHAMISQPKQVEHLFGSLPEGARKAIEERDKTKEPPAP